LAVATSSCNVEWPILRITALWVGPDLDPRCLDPEPLGCQAVPDPSADVFGGEKEPLWMSIGAALLYLFYTLGIWLLFVLWG